MERLNTLATQCMSGKSVVIMCERITALISGLTCNCVPVGR